MSQRSSNDASKHGTKKTDTKQPEKKKQQSPPELEHHGSVKENGVETDGSQKFQKKNQTNVKQSKYEKKKEDSDKKTKVKRRASMRDDLIKNGTAVEMRTEKGPGGDRKTYDDRWSEKDDQRVYNLRLQLMEELNFALAYRRGAVPPKKPNQSGDQHVARVRDKFENRPRSSIKTYQFTDPKQNT